MRQAAMVPMAIAPRHSSTMKKKKLRATVLALSACSRLIFSSRSISWLTDASQPVKAAAPCCCSKAVAPATSSARRN
ncbi:hypothetical protein D3C81_2157090 [compost metagenome]